MTKLRRIIHEEMSSLNARLLLARCLLAAFPPHTGRRIRTLILRRVGGLNIGKGTLILGTPVIVGPGNPYKLIEIGKYVWINIGVVFDLGSSVIIKDEVAIGHHVLLLTNSHMVGGAERRSEGMATAPILVEEGAWIGAGSIILSGITVGRGAVVAAGSVVNRDVPPNTLVGGVPAKVMKYYDEPKGIHEARTIQSSLDEQEGVTTARDE